MSIQVFDPIKHEALLDIRSILMESGSMSCDVESYEPTLYVSNVHYYIPAGYHVTVDYNKMAEALYAAGYRKEKRRKL